MKENQRDKLLKRLVKKESVGGRSAAIDLLCAQCIYDSEAIGAGSWRSQVAACGNTACGVYRFRPMPTGDQEED